MWDIVLIVVVALTPLIISLLYLCLSLFLVGDIKFVCEIEKDVEKNNTGA